MYFTIISAYQVGDQVYAQVLVVHTGLAVLTQLGDLDTSVVIPLYFVS